MKKRFLCLLLILVMTLSLLPTAVLADDGVTNYGITVFSPNGRKSEGITSANYKNVMGDGTVSYDPETKVLTLNGANLGCIKATTYDLTLNLVGNNTIIPSVENVRAIYAEGLSIQGEGSLEVAAKNSPIHLFNPQLPYRQSGGNVTLKSNANTIWQDVSGIKLTGGTLTLGGTGLQGFPAKLDAMDGTTLKLFDKDEKELGSWTLPKDSANWQAKLSEAAKMELTAPELFANLTAGETYYFDLSDEKIPGAVYGMLPDKSLHYVLFTYAGKLEDVYRIESTEAGLVNEPGSWPLFIAGFDVSKVSWDDLEKETLIYGKTYQKNDVTYTLRTPSGYKTKNEWDAMRSRNIINRSPSIAWVQETPADAIAYYRDSTYDYAFSRHRDDSTIHYRPVLQPTSLYGTPLHVVTLVVGDNEYKVIAGDTVKPASIAGLAGLPSELEGGCSWKDKNGTVSDSNIPVTDDMTLTAVPRDYKLTVIDKKGNEHTVTAENKRNVLGDGTVSYDPGNDVLTLKDANLQGISLNELSAGTLTLQLKGRSTIHAKGNNAISVPQCLIVQGSGQLSLEAENGKVLKLSESVLRIYQQEGGHVTMPESALQEVLLFKFSGGTLTLTAPLTIPKCLQEGAIAAGTELRLVNEDGKTISWFAPLENWESLEASALHAAKLILIAKGETLPVDEPEEPEEPSLEGVVAGAMALLASGDDNPFRDVRAIDWFYDDVMYAYDRGLINGTAYDKFSPKDSFTRGMLLTILARHDGVNTKGTPWYQTGCDWAAKNGISDGENPEEAIFREEFALILYRYAQYLGKQAIERADLSRYTDAGAVSETALPAVQWAAAEAILRGDNFRLNPQDGTTRAEAAAMLHRFFTR